MKNLLSCLLVCGLSFSMATAQSSFTEVTSAPSQSVPTGKLEIMSQSQSFTATISAFEAETHGAFSCDPATSTTLFEDFSNNLLGAASVSGCSEVLDCNTDDACFAPGGVQCGFSLTNIDNGDLFDNIVLLTTGHLGSAVNYVGPDDFIDDFVLNLDLPSTDVSFDFASLFGGELVDLYLSDEFGNPIGVIQITTTTLDMPSAVTISTLAGPGISQIIFRDVTPSSSLLIGDLSFCVPLPPTVPTLGEWAVICLGLMMLIFGVVYISATKREVVRV